GGSDVPRLDRDRAAVRELDRVGEEVEEDLANARGVAPQRGERLLAMDPHLEPLAPRVRLHGLECLVDQADGIDGMDTDLYPARIDLREVQDVVDQGKELPRARADAVDGLDLGRGERAVDSLPEQVR